jgi:hypothetical protein
LFLFLSLHTTENLSLAAPQCVGTCTSRCARMCWNGLRSVDIFNGRNTTGGGGWIGTRLLRIFRFSEEFGFFREVNGACSLNKSVNLSFTRVMQISRHNIIRSGNFLEFPSSADRFLEKFQKWFNRKKWFKWVDWGFWEFPLNYISFVRSGDFEWNDISSHARCMGWWKRGGVTRQRRLLIDDVKLRDCKSTLIALVSLNFESFVPLICSLVRE